jgi:hypothetical protein
MQARRILGTTLLVASLWIRLAPAQEPRSEVTTIAAGRIGIQAYAVASNGWTIQERDRIEGRTTDVEVGRGAGVGLRVSYELSHPVAAYVEADLNAEREGVYGSYAAGVFLRSAGRGPMRFRGRVGGRIINVVAPLAYADLGLGGELFVARTLALGLDLSTAVPLGDGSRDTGTHRVEVSPEGGPERLIFGVTWYPAW